MDPPATEEDKQDKDEPAEQDKGPYSLDTMILQSINSLDSDEQRKKMLSSVLLVGGSILFPRFPDVLHDRVVTKLQPEEAPSLQITFSIKDMDPRFLSWKGGTILCKLEASQEAWVSKEEYSAIGIRALRERALFEW